MTKPAFAICEQQMRRSAAHPRSLISAFVVRCLDSIIHLVSISEISSLYLASEAEQTGLVIPYRKPWRQVFFRDGVQILKDVIWKGFLYFCRVSLGLHLSLVCSLLSLNNMKIIGRYFSLLNFVFILFITLFYKWIALTSTSSDK